MIQMITVAAATVVVAKHRYIFRYVVDTPSFKTTRLQ